MKIETGGYYRNRLGDLIGPMVKVKENKFRSFSRGRLRMSNFYDSEGRVYSDLKEPRKSSEYDLISSDFVNIYSWDEAQHEKLNSYAVKSPKGDDADYYKLPSNATDLQDLIEYKKMDFATGNIFKACFRLGEKSGTSREYDLDKIIYFANRLKQQGQDHEKR